MQSQTRHAAIDSAVTPHPHQRSSFHCKVLVVLAICGLAGVVAAPSSAATESVDRRGGYAGYTAAVDEPSTMTGILKVPDWRQCDFSRVKAITAVLGLGSTASGQASLELNTYCSPEEGHVSVGYLHSGSDMFQLPWQIFQTDRYRLEIDVKAGVIRVSNLEGSVTDEHKLPPSFAADLVIARSEVISPDVGYRFIAFGITKVAVDGVSLAQLDSTKHEQVYRGAVIAYPTDIDQGGDFRIRATSR